MKIKIVVAQYVYWVMNKNLLVMKDILNLSSTNCDCINVPCDSGLIVTVAGCSEEFSHGWNQSSEILPLKVKLCLICYQLKLNQGSHG